MCSRKIKIANTDTCKKVACSRKNIFFAKRNFCVCSRKKIFFAEKKILCASGRNFLLHIQTCKVKKKHRVHGHYPFFNGHDHFDYNNSPNGYLGLFCHNDTSTRKRTWAKLRQMTDECTPSKDSIETEKKREYEERLESNDGGFVD